MKNSPITVVIGNNNYTLRADAPESMRDIPVSDRKALIAVLEQLKLQHQSSLQRVEARLAGNAMDTATSQAGASHLPVGPGPASAGRAVPPGERLGAGDIDDLMVRLAKQERHRKKPSMRPATIYKWAAVVVVVIVVLSLF